jgi:Tol biopolymer transport system component
MSSRITIATIATIAVVFSGCAGSTSTTTSPTTAAPAAATTTVAAATTAPTTASPTTTTGSTLAVLDGTTTGGVDEGRVLVSIERNGAAQGLAVFDATGQHDIDQGPTDSTLAHQVWAGPDQIVFSSERNPPRHLYSLSMTSGLITQLTSGVDDQDDPTVLPDSQLAVWEETDDSDGRDLGMFIGTLGKNDARQLTPASADAKVGATNPTLSPDGKWVAFVQNTNLDTSEGGLFIVRTDGTGLRRLTDDAFSAYRPRWSPDGTKILVTKHIQNVPELWLVPIDGAPTALKSYPDGSFAFEADWSPSGKQIVFKYFHRGDDHNELRVMNADGTGERTLWVGSAGFTAETPDWGP